MLDTTKANILVGIDRLVQESHNMAANKGWWGDGYTGVPPENWDDINHEMIGAKLALIHSEASEALECVRDGHYEAYESPDRPGKPEGLPSELADIVIRVADLAGALGIDLGAAIVGKMAYNETRTHRHGGRNL